MADATRIDWCDATINLKSSITRLWPDLARREWPEVMNRATV